MNPQLQPYGPVGVPALRRVRSDVRKEAEEGTCLALTRKAISLY